MCFSAGASFGVGIALFVTGIVAVKKVTSPSQLFFASIPSIFGIQQIIEGILWLSLSDGLYGLQQFAMYAFIFFAWVVWPWWIPLSIFKIEKKEKRKRIMLLLLYLGIAISIVLTYALVNYRVHSKIADHHIFYDFSYEGSFKKFIGLLYILPTITPLLFSSIKRMWILGGSILLSFIISQIVYKDYSFSIWCFFAAVISVIIVWLMTEIRKAH